MSIFSKPWVRLGLTESEWSDISPENQVRLVETEWARKKCAICGKAVMVLRTHEGQTWCAEHGGSWKEANAR